MRLPSRLTVDVIARVEPELLPDFGRDGDLAFLLDLREGQLLFLSVCSYGAQLEIPTVCHPIALAAPDKSARRVARSRADPRILISDQPVINSK